MTNTNDARDGLAGLPAKWREPRADDDCTVYTMGKRDGRRGCALDLMAALAQPQGERHE